MTVDGDGGEARDQPAAEVINVWSGPRSLSTSLMYSFAQVFSFFLGKLRTEISVFFGLLDPDSSLEQPRISVGDLSSFLRVTSFIRLVR